MPDRSSGSTSPGSVAAELTPRCNRRCLYCYNDWRDKGVPERPELSASEWIDLADSVLRQTGRGTLQITGGEPLLRPDLLDIIEGVRQRGHAVSLVTDGGLVTSETASALKALGVGPVQPTLLSADRVTHNLLKGVDCFDDTLEGIANLQRNKVPVSLSFVCTRLNFGHFRDVLDLSFALSIRSVAFSRFCSSGAGSRSPEPLAASREMVLSCLDVAEEAMRALDLTVHVAISLPLCLVRSRGYKHLRFGTCALGTASPGFTIDPWGGLRACSISSRVLGDLRSKSYPELMRTGGEDWLSLASSPPSACLNCPDVRQCRGGCRMTAWNIDGHLGNPDPLAVL